MINGFVSVIFRGGHFINKEGQGREGRDKEGRGLKGRVNEEVGRGNREKGFKTQS